MWRLNDNDLRKALASVGWDWDKIKKSAEAAPLQVIHEATLRHVYEEGEKPCPHDLPIYEGASRPRRLCSLCWAELRKECS